MKLYQELYVRKVSRKHRQDNTANFVMCIGESHKAMKFAWTASRSIALNMYRRRSDIDEDAIANDAENYGKAQQEILQASGIRQL